MHIVKKISDRLQGERICGKAIPEFFCRGIVKERRLLIQIRKNHFVAELLNVLHASEPGTESAVGSAQGRNCFYIEQLEASRLQQRRRIRRTIVGFDGNRTKRRHLPRIQRPAQLGQARLIFGSLPLATFDLLIRLQLELSEELVAPFRVLPVLLIIAQPKRGVDAEENENKFGYPVTDA